MVLEEAGPLQYGRQGLAKAYKAGNLNLFTLHGTLSVPASFVTAVDSSWEKAKPWKGLNSMSRVTMQEILSRSGLQPLPFEVTCDALEPVPEDFKSLLQDLHPKP